MKLNTPHKTPRKLQPWAVFLLGFAYVAQPALANPVWHCSRSDVQIADASDQFTLAALTLEKEVIRITLNDLYGVYQGNSVRMSGGLPLSACVLAEESSMTSAALESIGTKPNTIRTILNKAGLSKNIIHMIHAESDMLACISKNHPAIGYLPKATHTEAVGPCF